MRKTRLSLLYPATYLLGSGAAILIAPQWAMRLLGSNGNYDDVMPRVAGMFLFGLGMLVVQIMRYELERMYSATVAVRVFFCICLIWFYFLGRDPFFLVVVAVVALGIALTGTGIWLERRVG